VSESGGVGTAAERRTATFLFTDLEGSTRLLERLGDDYADILGEHWRLLREAATAGGGEEFGAEGDAMFFAFETASAAAQAAVAAQLALLDHPWPDGVGVRVRMALHTGDARIVFGSWVGLALHHAARICAAGHGGQILVSPVTTRLLAEQRPPGLRVETLGEYRLRDVTEPQELGQLEHERLERTFPPLRTPQAAVTNLPNALTTFVGRGNEIAEVRRLVETHRLVTVTGPGGAGKTRLAYEAAGDAGPSFDDGVWVAELATIDDAEGLVRTVATAVGAPVDPAAPGAVGPLVAHLRAKRVLLVLDNCEHVIDDAAALAVDLLRACPGVHVLATSRETLRVDGEQTWPIPAMGDEAVRLFADRAVLARPSFEVSSENEVAVRRICRRLDDLPLAIELAAARVASFDVADIERRLDDRFALLSRGTRTAGPRQQTLRALVGWSHDLLDPGEQLVLRRLGIFVGSFPIERAAAVIGDGDGALADDGIASLVAKSLVVREDGPEGHGSRFRLLETIREYALERLDEAGEVAATRDAHLASVVAFAVEATAEILGPRQRAWLDRLDAEWPDLRRALEHGLAANPSATLEAAGALGPFFAIRGHVGEGRTLLDAALDATPPAGARDDDPAAWWSRVRALAAAGTLARGAGDFAAARRHHEEQLALVRADPDEELSAKALSSLGNVVLLEGDLAEARRLCEESLAIRRRLGAPRPLALALNNLGVIADCEGDFAAAESAYREHLDIMRTVGDDRVVGQTLTNLALVLLATGRSDDATTALDESLALLTSVGDHRSVAVTRAVQAGVWRDRGELRAALAQYGESLRTLDELDDPVGVGMCLDGIGTVLVRRGGEEDAVFAARLAGASSRLPIGPGERGRAEEDAVDTAAGAARSLLGSSVYDAAFGAGAATDAAAIVREALAYIASAASGWVSEG
jgi:predicted ATPase/class 3 adenylate cyclase